MTAHIQLDMTGTALAADRCGRFVEALDRVVDFLDREATEVGARWPPVRVLVTDDFVGAVQDVLVRLYGASAGPPYGSTRMGGAAAARTMPDPLVEGGKVVVVDASLVTLEDPDIVGIPVITQAFILAHELTHVLIDATRQASGVLHAMPAPASESEHFAREAVRIAIDEYRADMTAARTIGTICFVVDGEGTRFPATLINTAAFSHLGAVDVEIPPLHPGLPDVVDRYRRYELSLQDMWAEIRRATTQGLNLLAHAQSVIDSTFPTRQSLLSMEEFASRAAELYFAALWDAIYRPLSQLPPLPSAADHARGEPALIEAGVAAIKTFWGILGITSTPQPDGSDYLRVVEPAR